MFYHQMMKLQVHSTFKTDIIKVVLIPCSIIKQKMITGADILSSNSKMVTGADVLSPNVEMVVGTDVLSSNDEITGTFIEESLIVLTIFEKPS